MADDAPKEKKLTKKELRILERQRAAVRPFPLLVSLRGWHRSRLCGLLD